MNNHYHDQVCSVNSFTVYLNILEYSSSYLPTAANESEVLHIQRKASYNWFRKTEMMHSVIFSPLKISFTSAISLVGSAPTYGRPEFESQLEDLSQSCPLSLPLRFLSPLHCPIIKKKCFTHCIMMKMKTVAHLLTQIWTLLSIYSLFHSRVWDICELLAADSSMMLYRNYALEANWMHTNIAVKFLSRCFSFNFCTIFVFLLLKSTASTSSLLITVSVAWTLYSDVLFLERVVFVGLRSACMLITRQLWHTTPCCMVCGSAQISGTHQLWHGGHHLWLL